MKEKTKGTDKDKVKELDTWRPKKEEKMSNEMVNKTVNQNTVEIPNDEGVKSVAKGAFAKVEKMVYGNVMDKARGLYFDNNVVSAKITKTSGLVNKEPEYVLEVIIHNNELRNEVEKEIEIN